MTDTVDPKMFRKGDRVLIEGFIGSDYLPSSPSTTWVTSYDSGTHVINVKAIKAHFPAPRPIEVGDRVKWNGRIGDVRGLNGHEAWIEVGPDFPSNSANIIVDRADLERLPE